jgi:hypothetical protein
METGGIIYYGLSKNGDYDEKENLDDINSIGGYEFIIKKEFHHFGNPRAWIHNYPCFKFTNIDKQGKEIPLVIGRFECTSLGFEEGNQNFSRIVSKIRCRDTKDLYDLKIDRTGIGFIKDNLLPALGKLNALGSWENYEVLIQKEELENENKRLKETNRQLRKEKEELSKEISTLNSKIEELTKNNSDLISEQK